ncbi:MAG: Fumarate reductase iron-sulfur subunit [Candidatus Heimdallarchaeota archaeon LC_3]|nr:MAG: Fumarate reductase iron-sulfur subunit [Candidatus Heimdallarchaeota archaeon LC_3]
MEVQLVVQRGESESDIIMEAYKVKVDEGSVVLDAIHALQAQHKPDFAIRWNCKAGKCGSCSIEVNGIPCLSCMTKLSDYDLSKPLIVKPMKTFPIIKDLVVDVSWNYETNKRIPQYKSKIGLEVPKLAQKDVDRIQEFRKCIECYLCQNTCHVLRTQDKKEEFIGPRFLIRLANLQMHPLDDQKGRLDQIYDDFGIGYCNITKCCTEVCPELIGITDNGIIPLKERVADHKFDPVRIVFRKLFRKSKLM